MSKESRIIESLRPRAQIQAPIATDMFLPNYSVLNGIDLTTIDDVKKNAFCEVTFGIGEGGEEFYPFANTFKTVNFSALDGYNLTDPGSNWNAVTNVYVVPVAGYYRIMTKLRVCDGQVADLSYGQGSGTSNGDGSNFMWFQTAEIRNGSMNIRIMHCNANDEIRMFTYTDTALVASDGNLTIELLYTD